MALYRIGTAARLRGLEIARLRNWEARYGTVVASRNAGGQRLYSPRDVAKLRMLKRLLDAGFSAREANNLLRASFNGAGIPVHDRAPIGRAGSVDNATPGRQESAVAAARPARERSQALRREVPNLQTAAMVVHHEMLEQAAVFRSRRGEVEAVGELPWVRAGRRPRVAPGAIESVGTDA